MISLDERSFYVYVFRHMDGTPFYVGKGANKGARRYRRAFHPHKTGNGLVSDEIKRLHAEGLRFNVDIVFEAAVEADAFAEEKRLIALHGRTIDGGSLLNMKIGGFGGRRPGYAVSEATRKKISIASKGKKRHSEEQKLKWSLERSGKSRSPEAIRKSALAMLGRVVPDHVREKISAAQRGIPRKRHSAETKAKMAVSALVGWEKRRSKQGANRVY